MELYERLNEIENKSQIRTYERLLERINAFYTIYQTYGNPVDLLDEKVKYCLDKGLDGIKYYAPSYFKSELFHKKYSELQKKFQKRDILKKSISVIDASIKGIEKELEKTDEAKYKELLQLRVSNSSNTSLLENSYAYFESIYNKFPELIENSNIKSILFLSVVGLNSIPLSIKKELEDNKKAGLSIINTISKHIENGDIVVNVKDILSTIKTNIDIQLNEEKNIEKELTKELPSIIIQDHFISETEKLKRIIKNKIDSGISKEDALNSVLPEAYALVKAAINITSEIVPYDVQLIGAMALNDGKISEMYTGEGKTITAIFPAYLNALTGEEVDIFTPNDYLASRDAEKNSKIFELLGMTTGCTLVEGQSIIEKQKAYKSNIVYGSSTAFAFDYLRDTAQNDPNMFIQRQEKPGMVIIDEADQILINNALSPYSLEEAGKPLTIDEEKDNVAIQLNLNRASIFARALSEDKYVAKTTKTFENITGNNEKVTQEVDRKYSLVVVQEKTSGAGQVVITEKGMDKLFVFEMNKEISELSKQTRTFFEENPNYESDVHYKIENGKFSLTMEGLKKACEETEEFFDLKLRFLSEEKYAVFRRYVQNSLTAEYLMEKGINYTIGIDEGTGKEVIKVLQDGRIIPNSKFTNGLHEAIALKEGLSIVPGKNERLLDKGPTTISNRALISRYSKRSGMTGTADKDAFYEIYGMDTFNVPRNKQYIYEKNPADNEEPIFRKDLPDKLYKTKQDKIEGILEDVIESHNNGQPVLVIVDSTEEANQFFELLTSKGYSSNLLVADKNLEEESIIIAEAGKIGAITVATEMAGRGTDIKLGGEKSIDREQIKYDILTEEALNRLISNALLTKKNLSLDDKKEFINQTKKDLLTENKKLSVAISKLMEKYKNDPNYKRIIDERVDKKVKETTVSIAKVGGLKYIQMNPFKTTRNDDQGKGRVGRQGEPGTTRIYASIEELPHIGVDREHIKELNDLMGDKTVIDDYEADGRISEIIETAQSVVEYNMDMQIANTDTMDLAISSRGMSIFNAKKDMAKRSNDEISTAIENMIESTITDSIKNAVPSRKRKKVNKDKSRLSRMKLNTDLLSQDILETFGISINDKEIFDNCTTVGELRILLNEKANQKRQEIEEKLLKAKLSSNITEEERKTMLDAQTSEKNKSNLISYFDGVYTDFMEGIEDIQLQIFNDEIAQNSSINRCKDIDNLYFNCIRSQKRTMIGKLFNVVEKKIEISPDENIDQKDELRREFSTDRIRIFDVTPLKDDIILTDKDINNQTVKTTHKK